MKLRNKKTGEIHKITNAVILTDDMDKKIVIYSHTNGHNYAYRTLTELNEEWEDYEEPKSWWYIDCNGEVFRGENTDKEHTEEHKIIGNYYNSSREAKKAVEKLKAWKRLKDKGFRFEGVRTIGKVIDFDIPMGYYRAYCDGHFSNEKSLELFNDLDLLFGGEE